MPIAEKKLIQSHKEIMKTIRLALIKRGWTQNHLAELLKVNKSQISRAIHGDMTPTAINLRKKIYEVLNIK